LSAAIDKPLHDMLEEVRVNVYFRGGRVLFKSRRAEELLEEFKDRLVGSVLGEERLSEAARWIRILSGELEASARSLGGLGWLLTKELRSFMRDPRGHLRKKLFQYSFDLVRGRISFEEFHSKAVSALNTSFRTNMRSIYQSWVFASLLSIMGERGGRLIYPEHGFIPLERTGRQRSGSIPPNAIVELPSGELSFFLEAPRPVGWGDSRDLREAWRLYVSLRPDILVYSGRVLDIVSREGGGPPILRPNVIIECKELDDWYDRVRELKGPFARPITAEEWMSKWLEGLHKGLADVLGVEYRGGDERRRERGLRLKEYKIVALYKETFKPDSMILVSRKKIPAEVRSYLEDRGLSVIDGVEIGDKKGLESLAQELESKAKPGSRRDLVEEVRDMLEARGLHLSRSEAEEVIKSFLAEKVEELVKHAKLKTPENQLKRRPTP
jgi:urease gamma subunit